MTHNADEYRRPLPTDSSCHWSQLMLHMVDELRRADVDPEDAAMADAAAAAAAADSAPADSAPAATVAEAAAAPAPSADADIEMGETDA